jgi:hypothetical protein
MLIDLPEAIRRTMTPDNGKEFAQNVRLEGCLPEGVYFVRPSHPWERGTIDNTNGLIRSIVPKQTNFTERSTRRIKQIENQINERPRKKLSYKTPNEVLSESKSQKMLQLTGTSANLINVMASLLFVDFGSCKSHCRLRRVLFEIWRHGHCRFTDVAVNEHPCVDGKIWQVKGELEHHDSPDLDPWLEKQNRYTTAEAVIKFKGNQLALEPRLLGNSLERRMWPKKNFYMLPGKYFFFCWNLVIAQGAWRAGWIGWVWDRLRTEVMRLIELKAFEMRANKKGFAPRFYGAGLPDPRVQQAD